MPATGESTSLRTALVTAEPISTASLAAQVDSPLAGAVVSFSGDVRDHDHGRQVASLVYEAHPSAQEILATIADEVAERFEVIAVAVAHRTGPLAIGDCALAAVVSAAHRGEAFAACTALVEETKARIPVWKHQFFTDGTDEWVNCA